MASSSRSRAMSARSVSDCELTDTYSPAAIDKAPATRPATPAIEDLAARGMRGGHADHQAGNGDDAVVGANHGGAKPADAVCPVLFSMSSHVSGYLRRPTCFALQSHL